jgi:hypothetical protein
VEEDVRRVIRGFRRWWGRYVASPTPLLNWIVVASFGVVILHVLFAGRTELFPRGSQLWESLYELSLALISSYIFYLVVVQLRRLQDKSNLLPLLTSKSSSIVGDAGAVAGQLRDSSGQEVKGSYPSLAETEAMCSKVGASDTINLLPEFGIRIQTHLEYLVFLMQHTKGAIAEIYAVMPYLDSEHVKLLSNIDDCRYFNILQQVAGTDLQ